MSHEGIQPPQRVEFTAECFGANLTVIRQFGNTWAITLFKFVGKARKYRAIATALGASDQVPRVIPGDEEDASSLWLGSSSMDIPPKLVPKLRAFIAEHTSGGAA